MATVDVIIPCYRYGHFLPDCVESVLSQEGVDVRVLIIDDASGDGSADVARAISARDPRVTCQEHAHNQGHIRTYNEGLDWAASDYTVLLSADDLLTPGALSRAAGLLDANPQVGLAYGHPIHFSGSELPPARTELTGSTIWHGPRWLELQFRRADGCITSPEVMVRTDLQKALGGYREDLPRAGDTEMWLRFAAHSDVGYVRGVDQAYYRRHQSMSQVQHSDVVERLSQRRLAFETVLREHPDRLDAEPLGMSMRRALGAEALWQASRAYDRSRTDDVPVDELVKFAFDVYPDAARLPEWTGFRVRQRLGPRVMPFLQPLVLTAWSHRFRDWRWWRSWERNGV